MRTNTLLNNHRLSVALADQRTARVRRHATLWFRALRTTLPDDPQRIRPLLRALSGSRRMQQRATAIILALGAPGGAALAALLPATIAAIEAAPPQTATRLRQDDEMLCAAISLVEHLAPGQIADVYRTVARQRRTLRHTPWWTFRPRQRLNEALQRRTTFMVGA